MSSPATSKFFHRAAGVLTRVATKFQDIEAPSIQAIRIIPWLKVDGDNTLQVTYDLNSKSTVFEVGGFKGAWSKEIFTRYGSIVHIFEPVDTFYKDLERLFGRNDKVHLYKFGLSGKDETVKFAAIGDTASAYKDTGESQTIHLKDIQAFVKKANIKQIDLMNINIEGGEYDLLERMIATGFIKNVVNVQVQFHDFVPDAEQRMTAIQANLSKTHKLTYQYPFVWENWQRKGSK